MSEIVVLIGAETPSAPLSWLVVSDSGRVIAEGVSTERRPPAAAPQRTVLVIPGADARLKQLRLPARSEAQARAGAAALFGADLSSGESMHFAVGAQQDGDGKRLVAAIASDRMTQWLESARVLGCDPRYVTLDCCLWPAEDGAIVVALTPARAIVTAGPQGGFSIEPDLAAAVLSRWGKSVGADNARIIVEGSEADAARAGFGAGTERRQTSDPAHTIALAAVSPPRWAPNLRQGAFAAVAEQGAQPFKLWRFAALLAAAALLLQVGSLGIAGWRDDRAADQVFAAAERDFRAARPELRRVVNLRAQVNAAANALDQATRHPVIVTSAPLISALRAHPGVRIDEVRHESPQRSVRLVISAPQQPEIEAFIAALRQSAMEVEAQSVQPREGRYAAQLIVEAR